MQQLQPGDIIDERYRLLRQLGSGGFGDVWSAEHLSLNSMVALKVLNPLAVGAAEARHRFAREAHAAAALRSPHVVQILDCGLDGDTPFIAMELLEGESLEQRLERVVKLEVLETERLVRHVARALTRAHEAGIVHRDLKPGNIFIVPDGEEDIFKVLDFGIAKVAHVVDGAASSATPSGILVGTPSYMSPEQIYGNADVDGRTDIWSLGVVAYECLLGELPFEGDTLAAILAAICSGVLPIPSQRGVVPAGFDAWFACACAADARNRFDSPRLMAAEFARICGIAEPSAVGAAEPRAKAASLPARSLATQPRRWTTYVGPVGAAALSILIAMRWGATGEPVAAREAQPAKDEGTALAPAPTTPKHARSLEASSDMSVADERPPPSADVAEAEPRAALGDRLSAHAPTPVEDVAAAPARSTKRKAPTSRKQRSAIKDCDPPWSYDEQGRPRAKRDCL